MSATADIVEDLPSEVRAKLARYKETIEDHGRAMVESMVEIGKALKEVRDLLSHHGTGRWTEWVEHEGIGKSQAHRLILAAETLMDRPTLERLEPTAIYTLSARSVPEDAKDEVEEILTHKDTVTPARAREIVAKYKPGKPEPTAQEIMAKVVDNLERESRRLADKDLKELGQRIASWMKATGL